MDVVPQKINPKGQEQTEPESSTATRHGVNNDTKSTQGPLPDSTSESTGQSTQGGTSTTAISISANPLNHPIDNLTQEHFTISQSLATRRGFIMNWAHETGLNTQDKAVMVKEGRMSHVAQLRKKSKKKRINKLRHGTSKTPIGFKSARSASHDDLVYPKTGLTPKMPKRHNSSDSRPQPDYNPSTASLDPKEPLDPEEPHIHRSSNQLKSKLDEEQKTEELKNIPVLKLRPLDIIYKVPTNASKSDKTPEEVKYQRPNDPIYYGPSPSQNHSEPMTTQEHLSAPRPVKLTKREKLKLLTYTKYAIYYLGPIMVRNEVYGYYDKHLLNTNTKMIDDYIKELVQENYTQKVKELPSTEAKSLNELVNEVDYLAKLDDPTYESFKSAMELAFIFYKESVIERLKLLKLNYPPIVYDYTPGWINNSEFSQELHNLRKDMLSPFQAKKWKNFTQGKGCTVLFRNARFTVLLHHSRYVRQSILDTLYSNERLYDALYSMHLYLPVPTYVEHVYNFDTSDRATILYFEDLTDAMSFRIAYSESKLTEAHIKNTDKEHKWLRKFLERKERDDTLGAQELKSHMVGVIDPGCRPREFVELERQNKQNEVQRHKLTRVHNDQVRRNPQDRRNIRRE